MKIKPIHIRGHRQQHGSALKQCSELILMISGHHPCNNYTSHIRPHFCLCSPFKPICMHNEGFWIRGHHLLMLSFIFMTSMLSQCGRAVRELRVSAVVWSGLTARSGEGKGGFPLELDQNKTRLQTPRGSASFLSGLLTKHLQDSDMYMEKPESPCPVAVAGVVKFVFSVSMRDLVKTFFWHLCLMICLNSVKTACAPRRPHTY